MEWLMGILSGGTLLLAIGALVVVVVFFMSIARVMKFIVKVPPNKALLVYGVRTRSKVTVMKRVPIPIVEGEPTKFKTEPEEVVVNYKIVVGGMVLVLPVVHTYKELDLSLMTLEVKVENVLSSQAVPITVDGIAQIKIGSDDTHIATAAEQLLDKEPVDIMRVAKETLMGHLRAIIGLMTVEKVYKDREAFAQAVLEVAVDDLAGMGLEIVSFTIKEIEDEKGYLEALGRPEIAVKLRDARIAEAEADKNATEKEQDAQKNMAKYIKTTNVAKAQYNAEVAKEEAKAEKAKPISLAEQEKTLEEKKTEAAEKAAERRNKELDGEKRRPADADLYEAKQAAEATKATGFAQAAVQQKTGEAEAAANKAKGLAGADVTKAQLLAEAEGRQKLADALNAYESGALRLVLGQGLLEGIPAVAESFGKAFANIDQIRLIEIGGAGAPGEGVEGAVARFLDMLPNTLFKFLQGATALIGGPIDDLVATWLIEEAEKRGISVDEEKRKAIEEQVAARLAKVEEEAPPAETPPGEAPSEKKTPAEEITLPVEEETPKRRSRRPSPQRKRQKK